MSQFFGIFFLVGGFFLVVTIIRIVYQLGTGKEWGRFGISWEDDNSAYHWVSISASIISWVLIVIWMNLASNFLSWGISSEPQPPSRVVVETYATEVSLHPRRCPPLTNDATYGYAETNPIKIGGGALEGVDRIRRYWNILRDAQGQPVNYEPVERRGATTVYAIKKDGVETTRLYVDYEQWDTLRIPVGFTCGGPIEIFGP